MSHPSHDEREMGRIQVRILKLRTVAAGRGVISHLAPGEASTTTRCCGVDVFELPDGSTRLVEHPSETTCEVQAAEDRPAEWWDR